MPAPWSPRREDDGTYSPSALAIPFSGKGLEFRADGPTSGGEGRRILTICTERGAMEMRNGKQFSTGNHPVETFIPILHFERAGFEVDIATPTGDSVAIEQWAMPGEGAVVEARERHREALESPLDLRTVVETLGSTAEYAAVFIPGGHGAMLGLPEDPNVGRVLRWAHDAGAFTLTICHGPAALLAAARPEVASDEDEFLYDGYEVAAFPDMVDRTSPMMGYLPGPMPWYLGEALKERGVKIVNMLMTGATHRDRRLVTGDSPLAANAFGRLAVSAMLDS